MIIRDLDSAKIPDGHRMSANIDWEDNEFSTATLYFECRGADVSADAPSPEAFLAGCVDAVFRTPQSYTAAKATAAQGLDALAQLPSPPDCLQPGPCRAERERVQSLFNSAATIAETGLKGADAESCKGPGSPAIFDHVIDNIRQQQRESPNVR